MLHECYKPKPVTCKNELGNYRSRLTIMQPHEREQNLNCIIQPAPGKKGNDGKYSSIVINGGWKTGKKSTCFCCYGNISTNLWLVNLFLSSTKVAIFCIQVGDCVGEIFRLGNRLEYNAFIKLLLNNAVFFAVLTNTKTLATLSLRVRYCLCLETVIHIILVSVLNHHSWILSISWG